MALIKCTECGKEFSDKAAACPNCGCPASEIIKGNTTPEEQKKAAEQIFAAVDRALDRARKAGASFELDSDNTKRLAKELDCNPNWKYGKDNIKWIVSDAVKACDTLYNIYQGLIPKLDAECRPLLQINPGAVAVRFVLGTIQWLNDESEIENNYAAHYEDIDLGTLVRAKYLPSEANRMIQAIWQTEYLKAPNQEADNRWAQKLAEHKHLASELERTTRRTGVYADLAERREEKQKELEDQRNAEKARLKAEEDREKAEEAERKAREKQKKAEAAKRRPKLKADKQKYEAALKNWESESDAVYAKRIGRLNEMYEEEKKALNTAAEQRRDNAVAAANTIIASETKRKQEAETKLMSLGAFKFSEKKAQKRIIAEATQIIEDAQTAISSAQAAYSQEVKEVNQKVNAKKSVFQQRVETELPLPVKPSKPQSLIDEEERIKREEKEEQERRKKEKKRKAINIIRSQRFFSTYTKEEEGVVEYMFDNPEPMTLSDMEENIPELYDVGHGQVRRIVRSLERAGIIEKYSEEYPPYYRISE